MDEQIYYRIIIIGKNYVIDTVYTEEKFNSVHRKISKMINEYYVDTFMELQIQSKDEKMIVEKLTERPDKNNIIGE